MHQTTERRLSDVAFVAWVEGWLAKTPAHCDLLVRQVNDQLRAACARCGYALLDIGNGNGKIFRLGEVRCLPLRRFDS